MRQIILSCLLLPVAWWDYKYGLIFNRWNIVIFCLGIIVGNEISFLSMILSAVVGAGSLLAIRILSKGGIGWGDIKLLLALAAWLTWEQQLLALMLSFWLGGAYGAWLLLTGKGKLKMTIPFGPFLALGVWIAFVWGQKIIASYMDCFYG